MVTRVPTIHYYIWTHCFAQIYKLSEFLPLFEWTPSSEENEGLIFQVLEVVDGAHWFEDSLGQQGQSNGLD